jgi:hypothetical protein
VELTLQRRQPYEKRTPGDLYVDAVFFGHVVEDLVRDRDVNGDGKIDATDVAAFKVARETAIPAFRYRVILEDSPKFGPDTLTLLDVPGFKFIRMHSGNDENDTEGCLIVGYKLAPDMRILYGTTKPAVADLKAKVRDAIARKEEVWITIIDPEAA